MYFQSREIFVFRLKTIKISIIIITKSHSDTVVLFRLGTHIIKWWDN